jgi:predicted nuclease of predicted toxin-antitoxin system
MKFKVDENLPVEAAQLLRQWGHDASTVAEQGLAGGTDDNLAILCRKESRALVTLDVDFADVRAYPPKDHSGLLVLRLQRQDKPHVLQVVGRLAHILSEEPLAGRLWIVEEWRVRIRG